MMDQLHGDAFLKGFEEYERRFLLDDLAADWTNPYSPETDEFRGFEAAVRFFVDK